MEFCQVMQYSLAISGTICLWSNKHRDFFFWLFYGNWGSISNQRSSRMRREISGKSLPNSYLRTSFNKISNICLKTSRSMISFNKWLKIPRSPLAFGTGDTFLNLLTDVLAAQVTVDIYIYSTFTIENHFRCYYKKTILLR